MRKRLLHRFRVIALFEYFLFRARKRFNNGTPSAAPVRLVFEFDAFQTYLGGLFMNYRDSVFGTRAADSALDPPQKQHTLIRWCLKGAAVALRVQIDLGDSMLAPFLRLLIPSALWAEEV